MNVSVSMTNRNVSEKENSTELCVEVVGFLDKDIIITVNSSNGKAIGRRLVIAYMACILCFIS